MLLGALLFLLQTYSGPPPAKADVPYLLHAGNLLAVEVTEMKDFIPGANSPAKTPLGLPIFIVRAEKIAFERMKVFPLQSRDSHRTVDAAQDPIGITITPLKGGLVRIEVNDSLPNGEYALLAGGKGPAFCFAVF